MELCRIVLPNDFDVGMFQVSFLLYTRNITLFIIKESFIQGSVYI